MRDEPSSVVVVGASIAGLQTAQNLRDLGYEGPVVVLGEEPHPPYQRPPLSKAVLAGTRPPESTTIAVSPDVRLELGARAVALDPRARTVVTADDRRWPYHTLVVATGSRARRLTDDPDELVLRSVDDCLRLRERVASARSLFVVGGGFLGMEVASTCAALGVAVTVVDREPPLHRLLGSELSDWVRARAEDAGVRLVQVGPGPCELRREERGWTYRADGVELRADAALTAVGDVPNTEWLASSGLALRPGLRVDPDGQAADGIFGVGDVTARRADGRWQRTPYWSAALEQAQQVAHSILGLPAPAAPTTKYFWSEQFGIDLRFCGTFPVTGQLHELDGSLATGSAILGWSSDDAAPATVAAVNHRTPLGRLRRWLTEAVPTNRPAAVPVR